MSKQSTPALTPVKRCSACEQIKSLGDFTADNRRKDGRGSKCRTCARSVSAAYYAENPETKARRLMSNAEHGATWHRRYRERQIRQMRWNRILRRYGLTEADYNRMLAGQQGHCLICDADSPGRNNAHFVIDHDHDTGRVRGLLCHCCNAAIGFFKEDLNIIRKAVAYVERHAQQE